jgi:hypothetical protein
LKAKFVCGGYSDDEKVKAIHPPIDDVLLEALIHSTDPNISDYQDTWIALRKVRWSKFQSKDYEQAINAIRMALNGSNALWLIEEFWKGHQK